MSDVKFSCLAVDHSATLLSSSEIHQMLIDRKL